MCLKRLKSKGRQEQRRENTSILVSRTPREKVGESLPPRLSKVEHVGSNGVYPVLSKEVGYSVCRSPDPYKRSLST